MTMTPEELFNHIPNLEMDSRAHVDILVMIARSGPISFREMVMSNLDRDLDEDGEMTMEAALLNLAACLAVAVADLAAATPPEMPPIE